MERDATTLRFDWDDVAHGTVSAVLGQNERRMNDGSLSWDAVALEVGGRAVLLSVNTDTDKIMITREVVPTGDGRHPATSLSRFVGRELGWCWVGTNSQGYADTFTLAFCGVGGAMVEPRLMFVGEGSALVCYDLTPSR